jgi:hypothetical protein
MWLSRKPYHFTQAGIDEISRHYGAQYMGHWCTSSKDGYWHETPVDVFYQPNPDTSKGHSHYFGMFTRNGDVLITNAESAFECYIVGALDTVTDEVLVSRYRHDYQRSNQAFIDGGRDYLKTDPDVPLVRVTVNGSQFNFEVVDDGTWRSGSTV